MQNIDLGPWVGHGVILAIVSFTVTLWMHVHTDGKSSPLAALAFFICGPVLGTLISIPYAIDEAARRGQNVGGRAPGVEDAISFAMLMFAFGVLAAAVTAVIVAYQTRDYW